MDEPSAQLHLELRDSITRSFADRRPLLHHLNADTSWLLQLPRPINSVKHSKRIYYNILIDPWLFGGQSDVAPWFSQQWHAIKPRVSSIAEVEELAREVEVVAGGLRLGKWGVSNDNDEAPTTLIDCVAVSHEFTDHCHKETLLAVEPNVPVFATDVSCVARTKPMYTVLIYPFHKESSCPCIKLESLPQCHHYSSVRCLVR